ncbi:hypothetical protein F5X96DRAFT_674039 [Biscogniauxia mediterranea]|nr:hypothetical protein F5X96DRAFT_674039 [Biscogniauxia mediterranea]
MLPIVTIPSGIDCLLLLLLLLQGRPIDGLSRVFSAESRFLTRMLMVLEIYRQLTRLDTQCNLLVDVSGNRTRER